MWKIFLNKKWESLIEIMIAVVILTIVLISMSKILWNAKITSQSSEKRIEAVALAKEWLEIFRYYRKNNYMQYSDKKRICWNFLADNYWEKSSSNYEYPYSWSDWKLDWDDTWCEESDESWKEWSANYILADDKIFIPSQNLSDKNYWRFFLTTKWQDLNTIWDKKDDWQIFTDLAIFQLCKNKDNWLIMSCKSMWLADDKKEKLQYFRALKIEYVDSLWQLCSDSSNSPWCDTSDPKSLNQIKVTSSVIWPVWTWIQSVDLTTVFTDFEDRIDRDS